MTPCSFIYSIIFMSILRPFSVYSMTAEGSYLTAVLVYQPTRYPIPEDGSFYEIRVLLGYYTAYSGNPLPKFRDNLSVLSSMVKNSRALKMGLKRCPETSVKVYHSTLRNIPEDLTSHLHCGGSLGPRPVSILPSNYVANCSFQSL
jgi:hypothetical protein